MLWRPAHRCGTVLLLAAVGALGACGGEGESGPPLSPEAEHGRTISRTQGCAACHGADGDGGVGPAWTGLYGREVMLEDGSTVVADETYLARAIADPRADIVPGYDVQMPENELDPDEVAAVIAYIEALRT